MKVRTQQKPNGTKAKGLNTSGKVSIHLGDPFDKFAVGQADAEFDGNISMYVRSLIKRDMAKAKAAA